MKRPMPGWRNGRRNGLKNRCLLWRGGSSPLLGTNKQDGFGRPILLFSKICDIIYVVKEKEIKKWNTNLDYFAGGFSLFTRDM